MDSRVTRVRDRHTTSHVTCECSIVQVESSRGAARRPRELEGDSCLSAGIVGMHMAGCAHLGHCSVRTAPIHPGGARWPSLPSSNIGRGAAAAACACVAKLSRHPPRAHTRRLEPTEGRRAAAVASSQGAGAAKQLPSRGIDRDTRDGRRHRVCRVHLAARQLKCSGVDERWQGVVEEPALVLRLRRHQHVDVARDRLEHSDLAVSVH